MPRAALPIALLAVWSCASSSSSTTADAPAPTSSSTATPAPAPPPPPASPTDAGTAADATSDAGTATYRNSLSVCWRDASCPRALAVAHGGDWSYSGNPYDSNAALMAAYTNGADGVKIDVRVTKDNVPVIAHSSPIEYFESLDCGGKKIEAMTAAEVTACHRVPSSTETFQRLDDVLDMLRGKLVIQLCVKEPTDYARTIAEVLAKKAADYAFIETNAGDMPSLIPSLADHDKVDYLVNVASDLAAVDTMLALKNPRIIMIEIDPTVSIGTLVATKLHPAGVRGFTYDDAKVTNASALGAHYTAGYDVVSSNFLADNVQARIQANQARGVTPP
jgi:hypothetical protein